MREVSRRAFFVAVVGIQVIAPSAAIAAGSDRQIEAALQPIRLQYGVPALGGAIVTPDGMQACGVVGVRKNGTAEAARIDDHWHLGSDTKAMTATLIGRLVEEGVLTWESTVGQVLGPRLNMQLSPDAACIRMIDLLHHRSGLPKNINWRGVPTNMSLPLQRLQAARIAFSQPLQFAPDSRFLYSNLGYTIAGTMAEVATGQSWEALIDRYVFSPLKMRTGEGPQCGRGLSEPWGHNPDGRPICSDNALVMAPAGCINSSMENWSKFIADVLRGAMGMPGLLQPQTYSVLQTPPPRPANQYACGWIVTRRRWANGRCFNHSGSNTINVAHAWVAPNVGFAVIAVTNQGGPKANKAADAACFALIELYQQRLAQQNQLAEPSADAMDVDDSIPESGE